MHLCFEMYFLREQFKEYLYSEMYFYGGAILKNNIFWESNLCSEVYEQFMVAD